MKLQVREGIASPVNFGCLLGAFILFPILVKWVDPFAVARIEVGNPEHTHAFMKFARFLLLFEWGLFFIAWSGVRSYGKIRVSELVGAQWNTGVRIARDVGVMPQNRGEALWFLALTVSAGIVEEFVFRGYLQWHLTEITGSAAVATVLQLLLFVQAHVYQGLVRLIPVAALGSLLTGVALWRKSLKPGMIGHALGDSLGGILYFLKHVGGKRGP
jgi:membrane protease YdiL (CAAX protease family)